MSQMDAGWQFALCFRMSDFMAHVHKISFCRTDFPGYFDGSFDGQVRGVVAPPERIKNKNLRPLCCIDRRLGNLIAVRVIGKKALSLSRKNEAVGYKSPVGQFQRMHMGFSDFKGSMEFCRLRADVGFKNLIRLKCISECPSKTVHRPGRCVNRHSAVFHLTESPQVIKTHDVVAVGMGIKNSIEVFDFLAKTLGAEIGSRIDCKDGFRSFDQSRGSKTFVFRVCGKADGAIAANDRYTGGSACSKKSHCEVGHIFDSNTKPVIISHMPATLASIRIKNFALVEDLTWVPDPGFNAVSGETGAGKSILIGALKLLLGERADRGLVRAGTDQCAIEALFEAADTSRIDAILEEAGVEPCEDGQLIIRRALGSTTNRQFVNGSPCNIVLLKRLGDLLVDLHGPHDHQSLFSREEQTRLLDDYSGLEPEREAYLQARGIWTSIVQEREEMITGAQTAARELDLLRHQVQEIESAALVEGQEEDLLARSRAASNAQKILELGTQASALIDGGEGDLSSLCGDLGRLLRELGKLDERIACLETQQVDLSERLTDLSRSISVSLEQVEADPARLREMEDRLDLIAGLKRKYGNGIPEVLTFADTAKERICILEKREEREGNIEEEVRIAFEKMSDCGKLLSIGRKKGAKKLARAVAAQLLELGFRQAGFEVHLDPVPEPGPHGPELVEFIFAPNPGEPPQPLRQIASSGEISRIMLALKCALAAQDRIALLVFDEIDANVGGETATRVGEKLRELGQARQVLCITHLPQVASAATAHFLVEKSLKEGRTVSSLTALESEMRETEIARMLGGASESALLHARTLLGNRE